LQSSYDDELDTYSIQWTEKHSCGVVIASEGYLKTMNPTKKFL